jgi:hypothetical protein
MFYRISTSSFPFSSIGSLGQSMFPHSGNPFTYVGRAVSKFDSAGLNNDKAIRRKNSINFTGHCGPGSEFRVACRKRDKLRQCGRPGQ